jgi:DNA-binding FadR family transcriptional regulator
MNAGGTMLRVYDALRERVVFGDFVPGERLDPARLAGELHASATPVRDALHRLTGERLIDSWQQEGFRQTVLTEALLRDLYGWSADLLALALRLRPSVDQPWTPLAHDSAYPDRAGALFDHIARRHDNHEIRHAVANVNARLHRARAVEAVIWPDCNAELAALADHLANPGALRRLVRRHHRRRLRSADRIAARLRPRDDRLERH